MSPMLLRRYHENPAAEGEAEVVVDDTPNPVDEAVVDQAVEDEAPPEAKRRRKATAREE